MMVHITDTNKANAIDKQMYTIVVPTAFNSHSNKKA